MENHIIEDMKEAQAKGKAHRVDSVTRNIFANNLKEAMKCVDNIYVTPAHIHEAVVYMVNHVPGTTIKQHSR